MSLNVPFVYMIFDIFGSAWKWPSDQAPFKQYPLKELVRSEAQSGHLTRLLPA